MKTDEDMFREFCQYLRNCTNAQVIGCYEKEKEAGRNINAIAARLEAEKRGINVEER